MALKKGVHMAYFHAHTLHWYAMVRVKPKTRPETSWTNPGLEPVNYTIAWIGLELESSVVVLDPSFVTLVLESINQNQSSGLAWPDLVHFRPFQKKKKKKTLDCIKFKTIFEPGLDWVWKWGWEKKYLKFSFRCIWKTKCLVLKILWLKYIKF